MEISVGLRDQGPRDQCERIALHALGPAPGGKFLYFKGQLWAQFSFRSPGMHINLLFQPRDRVLLLFMWICQMSFSGLTDYK